MDRDTEPKTETLFFRCGKTLFDRVTEAAEEQQREKSEFVRMATIDYLKRLDAAKVLDQAREDLMAGAIR